MRRGDTYGAGVPRFSLPPLPSPYHDSTPSYIDARTTILEHPPIPLRVLRPDAPNGFDRVLRKALEKQPRDRWKSAAAMSEALRPFLDGG